MFQHSLNTEKLLKKFYMNWYNLLALATEHYVFIFKEVSEQSSFIFGYNNQKNSHKQLHTSEDLLSKYIRNICTYSTRVTQRYL